MYEGIDSSLSDNFGRSVIYALNVLTTICTICYVGGLPFLFAVILIGMLFFNGKSRFLLHCFERAL